MQLQSDTSHHIMHRQEYFEKYVQENQYIFNEIIQIQYMVNKMIILPTNPSTRDHIDDFFKIPL